MNVRNVLLLAMSIALAAPAVADDDLSSNTLSVRFSANAISVRGLSPGATVLIYGVTREPTATRPVFLTKGTRVELLSDDDQDGTVTLELHGGVPEQGIWAVADITTGSVAVQPTPGYEPHRLDFTSELLKHDNAGQIRKLEWPLSEMELLVIRRNEGVWRLQARRHGGRDENRFDPAAGLAVDTKHLQPIGKTVQQAPNLRTGDVVVIFNPDWMEYGVFEVGK